MFADLLLNAIVSGIVLGGFYAAVSVGLAISFGMLDIGNLAHPAFVILGSFCVYILNQRWGVDPLIGAILMTPHPVHGRIQQWTLTPRGATLLKACRDRVLELEKRLVTGLDGKAEVTVRRWLAGIAADLQDEA